MCELSDGVMHRHASTAAACAVRVKLEDNEPLYFVISKFYCVAAMFNKFVTVSYSSLLFFCSECSSNELEHLSEVSSFGPPLLKGRAFL